MYGLVLLALKDVIIKTYSEEDWNRIVTKSHCPDDFVPNQVYDDQIVLDIVTSAVELFKIDADDLIEAAGYSFILCLQKSFEEIWRTSPHLGYQSSRNPFPRKRASCTPSQSCPLCKNRRSYLLHITDTSLHLHYTSGKPTRVQYAPLVVGIVKALAEVILGLDSVQVRTLTPRKNAAKTPAPNSATFKIRWNAAPDASDTASSISIDSLVSATEPRFGLTANEFAPLFPFHVMFNREMEIVQIGKSLARIISIETGDKISQHFKLQYPPSVDLTSWRSVSKVRRREQFCFEALKSASTEDDGKKTSVPNHLRLVGEMVLLKKSKVMCFASAPILASIAEANQFGLILSDFALHDQSRNHWMTTNAREQDKLEFEQKIEMLSKELEKDREEIQRLERDSILKKEIAETRDKTPGRVNSLKKEGNILKALRLKATRTKHVKTGGSKSIEDRFREFESHIAAASPSPPRSKSPSAHATAVASPPESGRFPRARSSASAFSSPTTTPRSSFSSPFLPDARVCDSGACPPPLPAVTKNLNGRLVNAFQELLLRDSWHNFPLMNHLMTLSSAADSEFGGEFTSAVIAFYSYHGKAEPLLQNALSSEITHEKDFTNLFRMESQATRLFVNYMKQECGGYLRKIIEPFINSIQLAVSENGGNAIELDSSKLPKGAPSNTVKENSKRLFSIAQTFLDELCVSTSQVPPKARRLLHVTAKEVVSRFPEMHLRGIGSLFLLRTMIPAMINPASVPGMEFLSESTRKDAQQRTILLLTKMLNNLVNDIPLGVKEGYMFSVSEFVQHKNIAKMNRFLQELVDVRQINASFGAQTSMPPEDPGGPAGIDMTLALGVIQRVFLMHLSKLWDKSREYSELDNAFKEFCSVAICSMSPSVSV